MVDVPSTEVPGVPLGSQLSQTPLTTRRRFSNPLVAGGAQHARPSLRRIRMRWVMLLVLGLVVLAAIGMFQLSRLVPPPVVHVLEVHSTRVPGIATPIPWPAHGQSAVAVSGLGIVMASGSELPVPIASLTKIMTAYVVLCDHPIAPGSQGPVVTITASNQTEAINEEKANDTSIPVQAGETLSERQLLDGLMVHSANNFAGVLADWDSGTVPAFVSKMNAVAASMGMRETHYADASGLDPGSVSTAAEQLRVASAAMTIPTFAEVVAQPAISLPIAGTMVNYVTQVGTDGIVGVKSGFTQAALGCLVLGAERLVDGHQVLVLAAVTGQPGFDPLDEAGQEAVEMIDAATKSLREVTVVTASRRVATVTTPWGSAPVAGETAGSLVALVRSGDTIHRSIRTNPVSERAPAGTILGTLYVTVGAEHLSVLVRSTGPITGPPVSWRLERF